MADAGDQSAGEPTSTSWGGAWFETASAAVSSGASKLAEAKELASKKMAAAAAHAEQLAVAASQADANAQLVKVVKEFLQLSGEAPSDKLGPADLAALLRTRGLTLVQSAESYRTQAESAAEKGKTYRQAARDEAAKAAKLQSQLQEREVALADALRPVKCDSSPCLCCYSNNLLARASFQSPRPGASPFLRATRCPRRQAAASVPATRTRSCGPRRRHRRAAETVISFTLRSARREGARRFSSPSAAGRRRERDRSTVTRNIKLAKCTYQQAQLSVLALRTFEAHHRGTTTLT